MSENAILLIFGILFLIGSFCFSAIVCMIYEALFPKHIDKIMDWLDVPTDNWDEWDDLIY